MAKESRKTVQDVARETMETTPINIKVLPKAQCTWITRNFDKVYAGIVTNKQYNIMIKWMNHLFLRQQYCHPLNVDSLLGT